MNSKFERWTRLGLYTLILASAACQNQEPQNAAEMEAGDKNSNLSGRDDMGTAPEKISIEQQIQDAIADLASRSGIAVDAITVKEARSVQWPSSAMGCPKPGMNYTEALVPGVRLLLEANKAIYYYHGRAGGRVFHCPANYAQAPAYGQGLDVM